MHGVFLVAAELASRGLIVSTTSRNAMGADLLVTDDTCSRACSVQVKTNGKPASFWLVGEKAQRFMSPSHVYVLVNVRIDGKRKGEHEYYVVASKDVAMCTKVVRRTKSTWYAVYKKDIDGSRDAWHRLGFDLERPA
jgi:hypothetical protein